MTARRRRALASAAGAFVVAILCAVLSSNTDGVQRMVLVVLTFAWLAIAVSCIANALRSAPPAATTAADADDAGSTDDPS